MKKFSNEGSATIEASLVFIVFIAAYLIINSVALSLMTESITRKAAFETGMELASYIQISERIGLSDIMKTNTVDIDDYKNIIAAELNSGDFSDEAFTKILDLFLNDLEFSAKKKLFTKLVEDIIHSKIKRLNGTKNIEDLGVKNLNIEDLSILENNSQIEFTINYEYELDKLGIFGFKNEISQKFLTDTWTTAKSNSSLDSIWDQTNFIRGRYFLDRIRSENIIGLKTGRGFDIYDNKTNTLIQVYSLNIFKQTYSDNAGDKYTIKDRFIEQINTYYKKLDDNINRYGNKVITLNGNEINILNPNKKLYIILPLEAEEMTNIKEIIGKLSGEIEFKYMEKAFND